MNERKDKLVSNVYKARVDELVVNANIDVYYCYKCKRLMTKEQALKISCTAE